MTSAPYFPLYLKDWLMDTRGFTHEDKGVLMDLLVIAWERGGLPVQAESIRRLAGSSKSAWDRVWPTVLHVWEERDGVLVYPKLESARAHMEQRSARAKAKAQKRWIGDGPQLAVAMLQHSRGNADAGCCSNASKNTDTRQQTTDDRQQTTENTRSLALARPAERLTTERFETFWTAYPRHEGRKDALRAFKKINPDHALLAVLLDAVTRWKLSRQWRDGFAPHASTWLNGERWTDQVPPDAAPSQPVALTKTQVRTQRNAAALEAVIASYQAEEPVA